MIIKKSFAALTVVLWSFSLAPLTSLALDTYSDYGDVFSDVSVNDEFAESIFLLYDFAILDGNTDGSFAPRRALNRAELAKLLVGAVYFEEIPAATEKCFEDIDLNQWYADYVCFAKDLGLVHGDGEEGRTFRPGDTTNVAEALSAAGNAMEWNLNSYGDGAQWYDKLFSYGFDANLLAHDYEPGSAVSREIFADILARSITVYDFELSEFQNFEPYDELYAELDNIGSEYFGEDGSGPDLVDIAGNEAAPLSEDSYIVKYDISGDSITNMTYGEAADIYSAFADDTDKHDQIWQFFVDLIPEDQRGDITQFIIFTDGVEEVLAYVAPTVDDLAKWGLAVDIQDSFDGNDLDQVEFPATVIHEFAHVLTLGADQVPPNYEIAQASEEEYSDLYWELFDECQPDYFPGEGCSKSDSYINLFFNQFWADLADEHGEIESIEDQDERYEAMYNFYQKYSDQFVTDYSATNPAEDIAETFAFFVLKDRPSGNSIADEKVAFLYDFPELVSLRNTIRRGLSSAR